MVIVMNVDLMDQKKQKEGECRREKGGLFRCSGVVEFSRGRMIRWKRDYFFPVLSPRTQGSRLVQEGRALP